MWLCVCVCVLGAALHPQVSRQLPVLSLGSEQLLLKCAPNVPLYCSSASLVSARKKKVVSSAVKLRELRLWSGTRSVQWKVLHLGWGQEGGAGGGALQLAGYMTDVRAG